jgi:hypothetical protein
MEKHMVECEDGRVRQARVYGVPKDEGDFEIRQAGVRLKGKHVIGEVWHSRKTGTWYFLTDPNCKFSRLLPRCRERPIEPVQPLEVSSHVRDR